MNPPYPFSAVVGLDDLRLALVLNAVSPAVGGVLARGEKGTAKSTVVRALHALLPPVRVVPGCRFSCDPSAPDAGCPDGPHPVAGPVEDRPARLVELPVGASEDRLVGSLDLERALTDGVHAYQPGLLAQAHRGVLYVDEVNLLADHLVNTLLDAAAMGRAHVEREGVSVRHAARFLLVGTMNPEEGELRPQLLDRFGLTVEIRASREPAARADVVRRRLAYEADPEGFAARWADSDSELAARIVAARVRLPDVVLTDAALRRITAICAAFDVDGLRADLVTARTAVALAAWHDRTEVTDEDIRTAARLALPHRRRRNPFDAPGLDQDKLDDKLDQVFAEASKDDPDGPGPDGGPEDAGPPPASPSPEAGKGEAGKSEAGPAGRPAPPQPATAGAGAGSRPSDSQVKPGPAGTQAAVAAGATFRTRLLTVPGLGRGKRDTAGSRSLAETRRGRVVRSREAGPGDRSAGHLHLPATLVAAAPHQRARRLAEVATRKAPALIVRPADLRAAVRRGREANTVLFCVDASGSMAARTRMAAVKGAVLSLLLDAYQRRDTVGLITFRGRDADLALPPTGSVDIAARRLETLPTGGRTPLAAGLLRASEVLRTLKRRDPDRRPLLVVVTDGRATRGLAAGTDPLDDARRAAAVLRGDGVAAVVVDCESGPIRLGLAADLAAHLGGTAVTLGELSADRLAGLVRSAA